MSLPAGDLRDNLSFVAGFWGWFIAQASLARACILPDITFPKRHVHDAQVMKVFTYRYKKGEWNLKALVDSGGMPSSHSSLCMAVTTSLAMQYGLSSNLFSIALCFSLIVMYDAAGVRRHAGNQAEVLNVMLRELMEVCRTILAGSSIKQRKRYAGARDVCDG